MRFGPTVTFHLISTESSGRYLVVTRSFIGFCIAMSIIFCWVSIYRTLRQIDKNRAVRDAARSNSSWRRNVKRKVAKMFFFVVISLYVCYIPLWLRGFEVFTTTEYETFTLSLVLANSAINPIIYSFTSKIFRDELFGRQDKTIPQKITIRPLQPWP